MVWCTRDWMNSLTRTFLTLRGSPLGQGAVSVVILADVAAASIREVLCSVRKGLRPGRGRRKLGRRPCAAEGASPVGRAISGGVLTPSIPGTAAPKAANTGWAASIVHPRIPDIPRQPRASARITPRALHDSITPHSTAHARRHPWITGALRRARARTGWRAFSPAGSTHSSGLIHIPHSGII